MEVVFGIVVGLVDEADEAFRRAEAFKIELLQEGRI